MEVLAVLFNKTESILIRILGYDNLPDKVKPRKGIYKVILKYLERFLKKSPHLGLLQFSNIRFDKNFRRILREF